MNKLACVVGVLGIVGSLAAARAARAEAPPDGERRDTESTPPRFKRVAVTMNPLAVVWGRLGGNVDLLPVRHHAITLSGFTPIDALEGSGKSSYAGWGG